MIKWISANRYDDHYPDSDRFDIERPNTWRSVREYAPVEMEIKFDKV